MAKKALVVAVNFAVRVMGWVFRHLFRRPRGVEHPAKAPNNERHTPKIEVLRGAEPPLSTPVKPASIVIDGITHEVINETLPAVATPSYEDGKPDEEDGGSLLDRVRKVALKESFIRTARALQNLNLDEEDDKDAIEDLRRQVGKYL